MPDEEKTDNRRNPCVFDNGGVLTGNREGFQFLQRNIESAMATGECSIDDPAMWITGIRVIEQNSKLENISSTVQFKERVYSGICLLIFVSIIVVLIVVLIVGVIQIWRWLI